VEIVTAPGSAVPPRAALAAIAVVSAGFVHAIPLAMFASVPSTGIVAMALIFSFFVLHPSLTIPLALVVRKWQRLGGATRETTRAAALTGAASGALVVVSHEVVDRFVLGLQTSFSDELASILYPITGALYGAITARLVSWTMATP